MTWCAFSMQQDARGAMTQPQQRVAPFDRVSCLLKKCNLLDPEDHVKACAMVQCSTVEHEHFTSLATADHP